MSNYEIRLMEDVVNMHIKNCKKENKKPLVSSSQEFYHIWAHSDFDATLNYVQSQCLSTRGIMFLRYRYEDRMTFQEIAECENITTGRAWQITHSALTRLAKRENMSMLLCV